MIRRALLELWRRLLFSPLRYSTPFVAFQELVAYFPNEEMLRNAMKFIAASRVEGDYLEFGVYQGANFVAAFHLAQRSGLQSMRFYAFDSFEGLPPVRQDEVPYFSHGEFACDTETFKKNVFRRGVDPGRTTIIPGWYNQALNEEAKSRLPIEKVAVVWVDCDLYESTVPVLNFIVDYLQDGSVLIFDDWFCFRGSPDRGEQRAFREWLAKNDSIRATQFQRFGWHGQSFIINKG